MQEELSLFSAGKEKPVYSSRESKGLHAALLSCFHVSCSQFAQVAKELRGIEYRKERWFLGS